MSLEDKKALRTMEQSVKLQDGHYQVALPWRAFPPFLPYNRSLAERRLRMLTRRFLQDNELFKNYKGTMEKYVADGHARRVPPEELHVKDRPLWYLPPHHVLNQPGKTRVVLDCAAKYHFCGIKLGSRKLLVCIAAFNTQKWLSNNSKALNFIPHEERAPSLLDLDLDKDKPPIQRALGLHWNMDIDMFTFKVNLNEKPNTRRGILSLTSSLYDPLGLVAPIILPAKKLLQDLCKQKLGWDDPIHDDDEERWEKWKNNCLNCPKLQSTNVLSRLALEN